MNLDRSVFSEAENQKRKLLDPVCIKFLIFDFVGGRMTTAINSTRKKFLV